MSAWKTRPYWLVVAIPSLILCWFVDCAATTSPSVPKHAIEVAADTKVPDAGADASHAAPAASEKP